MDGKIKIGYEELQNILDMMCSSDKENVVIALHALENVDHDNNFVQILLALRYGNASESEWITNAPKVYSFLTNNGFRVGQAMTFKRMCQSIIYKGVSNEDLQFFFDIFSSELFVAINELGCKTLESVKITLKFKENE